MKRYLIASLIWQLSCNNIWSPRQSCKEQETASHLHFAWLSISLLEKTSASVPAFKHVTLWAVMCSAFWDKWGQCLLIPHILWVPLQIMLFVIPHTASGNRRRERDLYGKWASLRCPALRVAGSQSSRYVCLNSPSYLGDWGKGITWALESQASLGYIVRHPTMGKRGYC